MASNPYLKSGRLPDVIAAITTLGAYKFYKLDVDGWANRIAGARKTAAHWKEVFDEHPEFFRSAVGEQNVSLVWRRQFPKSFNVDLDPEDGANPERISRRPLDPSERTALIEVAVRLHAAAMETEKLRQWWIPLAAAVLSFVGALLGVLVTR